VCACVCAGHGIAGKKTLKTGLPFHTSNLRLIMSGPVPNVSLKYSGPSQLVYTLVTLCCKDSLV